MRAAASIKELLKILYNPRHPLKRQEPVRIYIKVSLMQSILWWEERKRHGSIEKSIEILPTWKLTQVAHLYNCVPPRYTNSKLPEKFYI